MIKKPNIPLIGAFVIVGIALVIAGIVTFGAQRYFSRQPAFCMYFEGSVKGLNVGAPVVFKGVKVGTVKDISLQFNPETKSVQIEVLAEIDPHSITRTQDHLGTQEFFLLLIRQGLKAQLQYQNLLTGQLIIELDFHPEKPLRLTKSDLPYPQIPTTPSSIEELTKTLSNLPLKDLVEKLTSAINGISRVATSPELMQSIRSLNLALGDVRELVQSMNTNLPPLAADLRGTLEDSRKTLQNLDKQASSLQESLNQAAQATRAAMVQAEKTFRTVERAGSGDTPIMYQLSQTLEKISDASDSVRALTDYLNRHPEAILRGKKESGGK